LFHWLRRSRCRCWTHQGTIASASAHLPFCWVSSDSGSNCPIRHPLGPWCELLQLPVTNITCRLPVYAALASSPVPAQTDALCGLFIGVQPSPTPLRPTTGDLNFSDSSVSVASLGSLSWRALL
jgi:hypothetical protein